MEWVKIISPLKKKKDQYHEWNFMNGHLDMWIIEVKFTKTKHIQLEQSSFSINVIYVKQDSPGQLTPQTTKVAIFKNVLF